MLTPTHIVRLGVFLSVALLGVAVWQGRQRAKARALEAAGQREEARALLDGLDARTPVVVLSITAFATLLLVA